MAKTFAKSALTVVGKTSSSLIDQCRSHEDAVCVAAALMAAAGDIYRHIGGPQLAAAQFYAAADREAAQPHQEPPQGG